MNDIEQAEAKSFLRIRELVESPVIGDFDVAHLKEIHRRIFQDSPQHLPGQYRPASSPGAVYCKHRRLESTGHRYLVAYSPAETIEQNLSKALQALDGGKALQGLNQAEFAQRMAQLYGELDFAHPFVEGNSRTLRAFTAQLVQEKTPYQLDWANSKVDAQARDRLYVARDLVITQRNYPGLDFERASTTKDRSEYEAYLNLIAKYSNHDSLATVIQSSLRTKQAQSHINLAASPYEQGKQTSPHAPLRQPSSTLATAVKPLSRRF